jgi:hypothetical protein
MLRLGTDLECSPNPLTAGGRTNEEKKKGKLRCVPGELTVPALRSVPCAASFLHMRPMGRSATLPGVAAPNEFHSSSNLFFNPLEPPGGKVPWLDAGMRRYSAVRAQYRIIPSYHVVGVVPGREPGWASESVGCIKPPFRIVVGLPV